MERLLEEYRETIKVQQKVILLQQELIERLKEKKKDDTYEVHQRITVWG